MNSKNAIELEKVVKGFNHTIALNKISLNIERGGIYALLGPNGAGKTTLLRIICGILQPTEGKVLVLGKDPKDPSVIGKIGYLPQIVSGYHNLSAWENIKIFAQLASIKNDVFQKKADYLLEMLRLDDKTHLDFHRMSTGEQRAISLIRAIIIGSEILLLDEPTTGLDLERAKIVRNLISHLHEEGKTIVLSSHIVTDIEELAEKVAVLKEGNLLFDGRKEGLIERYAPSENLEQALLKAFGRQLDLPQPLVL